MTDQPMPDIKLPGVTPYLSFADTKKAHAFYEKAFGAEVLMTMPTEDGRLMHSCLKINGSPIMMSDAFPEHGYPYQPPQGYVLHLDVKGVDDWFNRAVEAGCTVVMPLEKQFWGDRYGQLRDPFGVTWSMGEPDQS